MNKGDQHNKKYLKYERFQYLFKQIQKHYIDQNIK